MLTNAVEENQQRESDIRPRCTRLRCLRCRSEVTCRDEGEEEETLRRRMRKALMLTGGDEDQDEEEEMHRDDDTQGERDRHKIPEIFLLSRIFSFLLISLSFHEQNNISNHSNTHCLGEVFLKFQRKQQKHAEKCCC